VSRHFDRVVTAPPLRHRIEDVRDLVAALLGRLSSKHVGVDAGALNALLRHPWPGNVGELEQALVSALRRHPSGPVRAEDLPPSVHCTARKVLSGLEAVERDMITTALLDAGGDKARAAERLGISRATIYRKIRTYGIVLPQPQTGRVATNSG
jgi:transcriptional regulator of acetoin/glycerol metabolism